MQHVAPKWPKSLLAILAIFFSLFLLITGLKTQDQPDPIYIDNIINSEFWVGVGGQSNLVIDPENPSSSLISLSSISLELEPYNNSLSNVILNLYPSLQFVGLSPKETELKISLDFKGIYPQDQSLVIIIPWDFCNRIIDGRSASLCFSEEDDYMIFTSCTVEEGFPNISMTFHSPESNLITFTKVQVPVLGLSAKDYLPEGIVLGIDEVGYEEKSAILISPELMKCTEENFGITIIVPLSSQVLSSTSFSDSIVKLSYRSRTYIPFLSTFMGGQNTFSLRSADNQKIGDFVTLVPDVVSLTINSESIVSNRGEYDSVQISRKPSKITFEFPPNREIAIEFIDTARLELAAKLLFLIGIGIAFSIEILIAYIWEKI
ncbi:MAG: hypothetical protein FVQ83_13740 [Chloroflexi bacterium]|nr:hypothetical protein [Chloroflexota bacterium]